MSPASTLNEVRFTRGELEQFCQASLDTNPLHLSDDYARKSPYGARIVHGILGALTLLGRLRERPQQRLARLELRFLNPLFLDQPYRLSIQEPTPDKTLATLFDGGRELLQLVAHFHTGPLARPPAADTPARAPREQPAELGLEDLRAGQLLEEDYSPRWSVLTDLIHQLGVTGKGVDVQQAAVLAWSSYLIGMEVPGRQALYSRLDADFDAVAGEASSLHCRTEVQSVEKQFGLVRLRARVGAGTPIASLELRAFVRPELPPSSVELLTRLQPESRVLAGKVALVIGGSRGLGAALVQALALQGCTVYLNYLKSEREAAAVRDALGARASAVHLLQGDGSDLEWCQRAQAEILGRHGRLDLLLCNACLPLQPLRVEPDPTSRLTEYVRKSLALVHAPLSCFLEELARQKGQAVVLSSSAVREPLAGWPHYVSAKCAIEGLARTAALEYPQVSVIVARPPRLLTELTNTPLGNDSALRPEAVATSLVRSLLTAPSTGQVVMLEDFTDTASVRPPTEAPPPAQEQAAPQEKAASQEKAVPQEQKTAPRRKLAIAATFTAEPLQESLEFWGEELKLGLEVEFAPYNQIFQELLAPSSLLSGNAEGLNVLLLRPEDWVHYEHADGRDDHGPAHPAERDFATFSQKVERSTGDLIAAVKTHKARSKAPLLVCLCPSTPELLRHKGYALFLRRIEERLERELKAQPGTYVLQAAAFAEQYPVSQYHDEVRDQMGHIPYTPAYFSVLGTLVTRALHSILTPPFKVIVLDCDNTLWKGVCGEDGPQGVDISPSYRYLQEQMVRQQAQGMILCLCSKNVESDVIEVFKQRPEMALKLEHITTHRINWLPKSQNLRSLAEELNVGLDSFIFLDDNPVEIAEVKAACPQVLALTVPKEAEALPTLVDHIWAFDRLVVTEEDKKRTQMYRQNKERDTYQQSATSFGEFLHGLGLDIRITEMTAAQRPRVSQLTQRTNQFNFTTVRRSEAELQQLVDAGTHQIWTTQVSDRFGDYGLVGVVISRRDADRISVDSFMLSCRVLGRGVEHAMLARLGQLALDSGLEWVEATFTPTAKNPPALRFLEAAGSQFRQEAEGRSIFRFPAQYAATVTFSPDKVDQQDLELAANADKGGKPTAPASMDASRLERLERITRELSEPRRIHERVSAYHAARRAGPLPAPEVRPTEPAMSAAAAPPSNAPSAPSAPGEPDEAALLRATVDFLQGIFGRFLSAARTGVKLDTHFEALGLTSFSIIDITVALEDELGSLPKTLLFEHKTLGSLARYLFTERRADLLRKVKPTAAPAAVPVPVPALMPTASLERPHSQETASGPSSKTDIAIIGISGRYPQARNLHEFWESLRAGRSNITEVPADRWEHSRFYDPSGKKRDKSYTKWGGFVEGVGEFDSLFFNISPKEAEQMDPQQRLFLEVVYEAVEDAGYTRRTLGRNVGVYAGVMANNYLLFSAEAALAGHSPYPYADNYQVANRISYFFDFSGPSLSIDTACSASGVALHTACEALRSGACSVAIAGGVNLILHPYRSVQYSQMTMLSRDERCRAFGSDAQGFVMGEGVGAVLLKPLAQALKDGDHIYGLIKGSAVNHGGRTSGFTVPNPTAQGELVAEALKRGGVDARSISYVEAHGTGTPLGDPIEVRGLTAAFRQDTADTGFCAIGSVKPNIGHLEPAAAIAGLTKVLLQMRHGTLVPSLNSEQLNPYIDFESSPFRVQRERAEWKRPRWKRQGVTVEAPRRAGLSSFGAGGVNAHLVVEEYVHEPTSATQGPQLIVLSAKNAERLRESLERLQRALTHPPQAPAHLRPSLGDIAYTLQVGRESFEERVALIVQDLEELSRKLEKLAVGEKGVEGVFTGNIKNRGAVDTLGEGEEALAFTQALIRNGRLDKLAQLWTQGAELPWEQLHAGQKRRRVPLPTYPFARTRHWLPESGLLSGPRPVEPREARLAPTRPHPMIDRERSSPEGQRFETRWDGSEFYLRDHVVAARKTLPGVAYLELARAAGALARGAGVARLRAMVWSQPILVPGAPVEAQVALHAVKHGTDVTISTGTSDGNRVVHARCRLGDEHLEALSAPPLLDLESLRQRCTHRKSQEQVYADFIAQGFTYGPTFQAVVEHLSSESEALSLLELPATAGEPDHFGLHPSLLDGALQTIIAKVRGNETYLPFALDELTQYGPLPRRCHAYVRFEREDAEQLRCNVRLLDETGRTLVALDGLTLRALKPKSVETAPSGAPLYRPVWERVSAPAFELPSRDTTFLLFDEGEERFQAWTRFLGERGLPAESVHLATPGPRYAALGGQRYQLRPEEPADHLALLQALPGAGPLVVLHAWRPREQEPTSPLQGAGLGSLLATSQALLTLKQRPELRLLALCATDEDSPLSAAVGGFIRSLAQESTRLQPRAIQLADPAIASDVGRLLGELRAGGELEVRLDASGRLVRRFQRATSPVTSRSVLREKGVYLITGGMGGLGLIFARHLVERYRASVVLTGRSALREEQQRTLESLQAQGAQLLYLRADITQAADIDWMMREVRARFGHLHGVLHSAGVIEDAYLSQKSRESFARVLAPKLAGTWLLDLATAREPLDFFVTFSSVASVFGSAGQTDYATANRFLDAQATSRAALVRAGQRSGVTLSLNWPLWQEGGMRVGADVVELTARTTGLRPLATATGLQAFEEALRLGEPQLAVLHGDRARIEQALEPGAGATRALEPTPAGNLPVFVPPAGAAHPARLSHEELLRRLQDFLLRKSSELLKVNVADIDPDDDMSDYGFDSISLTELANALNETFDLALTPVVFFENPAISGLARFLMERHRDAFAAHYDAEAHAAAGLAAAPAPAAAAEPAPLLASAPMPAPRPLQAEPRPSVLTAPSARLSQEARPATAEPIAIIGMAGVFPQSPDLETFWKNLLAGKDLIREVPEERWDWKAWYGDPKREPNKTTCKWGGFIDEVDAFDALFFNISPREAQFMDPQQRIFLETAWRAIEDAGYSPQRLSGSATGVFTGVTLHDYLELIQQSGLDIVAHTSTGNVHSIVPNRLSYLLNLRGPSEPIDTACSSSLVALHRAVRALQAGDCELAIAGGINVLLSPTMFVSFSKAGMLASDGRCKTFDARADGYVRGEGAGVVLLKPLSKAEADGDTIHAIIRGTAVNHGGHAHSLTAPNPNAQAELLVTAHERAGFSPDTVGYIETHGTGTELGDPIEIEGLKKAFSQLAERRGLPGWNGATCGLGAVKTNVGHLECASGMAGLLKTLLAMRHRMLPPNLHFEQLNPYIDLKGSPFYVVDTPRAWEPLKDRHGQPLPLRAGISSFGFGGVNAHVVIEEYVPRPRPPAEAAPQLFILSAREGERLKEYARRLRDSVAARLDRKDEQVSLADMAYTLQVGRDVMDTRLAIIAQSEQELVARLDAFLADKAAPDAVFTGQRPARKQASALVFGDDEDDKAYLRSLLGKGKLAKLASLWVQGQELDWTFLHEGRLRRRVELPTYPFAREKHWLPRVRPVEGTPTLTRAAPVAQAPAPQAPAPQAPAPAEVPTPPPGEKLLLVKRWRPAPAPVTAPTLRGMYLVLLNGEGAIDVLKDLGSQPECQWIAIKGASGLPRLTAREYELDFSDGEQGTRLITELLSRHPQVNGLVDLSDVYAAPRVSPDRDAGKVAVLQGLLRHTGQAPLRILHFTHGLVPFENTVPTLAGATVAGIVRMLGAEYGRVRAVTVDVDLSCDRSEELLALVAAEASADTGMGEVCYRKGTRYLPYLEEVAVSAPGEATRLGPFPVDPARTYVITGGTGGLGFEAARTLVAKGARRLALLGARTLPPRDSWSSLLASSSTEQDVATRVRRVLELEQAGAQVALYHGPLSDEPRLAAFFSDTRKRLGAIAGVIHCAGIVSQRPPSFSQKGLEDMRRVWEPKVRGLIVLSGVLKADTPDFFLLYSSVSAVVPSLAVGMADYASANGFLDAFAAYQAGKSRTRFLALNWPSWKDTGMGEISSPRYTGLGFTAHGTREGMELLEAALSLPDTTSVMPCVVNRATLRLDRMLSTQGAEPAAPARAPQAAPAAPAQADTPTPTAARAPAVDLFAATRELILELLSRELMIDKARFQGDAPFGDYGVDSIVIADLVTKMERFTGKPVDPSIILEHSTLDTLSHYLSEAFQPGLEAFLARGSTGAGAPAPQASPLPVAPSAPVPPPVPLPESQPAAPPALVTTAGSTPRQKIAVIGAACRVPGAESLEAYWENLRTGRFSISEVPRSRWNSDELYRPHHEKGKSISKWGGFLDGIELFDPGYFGIPEEDAAHMDPLIRLFLECSEQTLRNAGYAKTDLWNRRVGTFVGSGTSTYGTRILVPSRSTATGLNQNFIGAHVAHVFNFKGPNMVVDTACSSSLTSIYLACQSLAAGECELALAGGVDVLLDEVPYLKLSEAKALSPDGRCHTFDVKANGFVPGEGVGAILLKPLERALADGDRILSVIEACAMNNDGHTMGLTTPNMQAQQEVVQQALEKAGVSARTVTYVETHGTGTMIGDPIELKGLMNVFRRDTADNQFCAVGSVKTNIGHLMLAAGIAGFIKLTLSLQHRLIPPTLHCDEPNPRFAFQTSPFMPALTAREWVPYQGVRRAGISAFGFGGTNCHILVRDFDPADHAGYQVRRVALPPAEFRKKRYWFEKPSSTPVAPGHPAPLPVREPTAPNTLRPNPLNGARKLLVLEDSGP
ncbi:SDR family NAD(P)-dependent oxidoreductase [Hyalangium minutum]|uniref:Malonyl CoA-acyl carrier protein transacylase n=1 Tax=Hyalangium minutum TaxID=394096 RepID=A0A085WVX2_9BACT|nr:SDR family NAD(P)-dependent oxidoreductase [Hyalangium minutum]KFE71835.1 Malonyl CoA-acyl carrier protein transacylase [Hyalangium minutum]